MIDNIQELLKNRDHFNAFMQGKKGYLENGDLIEYFDTYVLINGVEHKKFVECPMCSKKLRYISNTHLWHSHSIIMDDFIEKFPDISLKSEFTKYLNGYKFKGKTYEEIYGERKGKQLKQNRSSSAIKQMEDTSQIEVRKEKCGTSRGGEQTTEKQLESRYGDIDVNYREKALSYYGEECQWCGEDDVSNISVHHIDENHFEDTIFTNNDISNLMVMCRSCHSKIHNLKTRGKWSGKSKIEKGFALVLDGLYDALGVDKANINFKETPSRVARAYLEMLQGAEIERAESIVTQTFPSNYDGMVVLTDIKCFSMCPHHFLPVKYTIDFGYIPDKSMLGLSKIPRFIKLLAQAPLLQEDFTKNVVDDFTNYVAPLGAIVVVKGYHMCMGARGIEMPDSATITSAVTGVFAKEASTKEEFFGLIELKK